MDTEGKSIAQIVKENAKREIPNTIFGMVSYEITLMKWQFITGGIFLFLIWLFFGEFLPSISALVE